MNFKSVLPTGPNTSGAVQLMNQLPIAKHFGGDLQSTLNKATQNKTQAVATILKLLFLGVVGYFSWVYVLPIVFAALGKLIAVVAVITGTIAFVFMLPAIFRWSAVLGRKMKKFAINEDPFGELEIHKKEMHNQVEVCRGAKGNIQVLEHDMKNEAQVNENLAEELHSTVLKLKQRAQKYQNTMDELTAKHGVKVAKSMDEYVTAHTEQFKVLTESQRAMSRLTQAKDFVVKYGVRAVAMKKMVHKLTLAEVAMESKVLDYDATIEILRKEYDFASKSRQATEAAKKAMMFDKAWELEYALDVISTTIAYDLAQTAGNFRDISTLTANFDLDNDEMFSQLDTLSNSIQTGSSLIPDASQYDAVDYELTQADRQQAGSFGSMF